MTVRDIERLGEIPPKRHGLERRPRPSTPTRLRFRTNSRLPLGAKSTIRHTGGESGDIRIAFRDFDQLDDFCRRFCHPAH